MPRPILVAPLLLALFPAFPAAGVWRPLELAPSGAILVPVEIDGRGPFRFLLDTGSSRSAISASVAALLGVRPAGETIVLTPSGRVRRPLAPMPRLRVDRSVPVPSLAMIVPDRDLIRDVAADGIIGADVLARFVLTIDYADRRLVWEGAESPPGSITLPLTTEQGRFVVSVPLPACDRRASACKPLQLIPDTGADAVVLFRRPGQRLPFVTPLGTAAVRSFAGTRAVDRVRIDAFDLDEVGLHGRIASLVDLPVEDDLFVDGLLPLHLFSRVTLDGPAKRLTLTAR